MEQADEPVQKPQMAEYLVGESENNFPKVFGEAYNSWKDVILQLLESLRNYSAIVKSEINFPKVFGEAHNSGTLVAYNFWKV
ncbi:MAG: hypothetical protein ABI297_06780 [Ginsengibacter sp.]